MRDAVDVRVIDDGGTSGARSLTRRKKWEAGPYFSRLPRRLTRTRMACRNVWEKEHGLDPRNAEDGNGDDDHDGYTNLEEYVNGLCADERLPSVIGDDTWRATGPETVFDVTHNSVVNPVQHGKWRLNGVAAIRFVDRIEPHENSVLVLVGPGVQSLEGRFSELRLPGGWRGELAYNDKAARPSRSNT